MKAKVVVISVLITCVCTLCFAEDDMKIMEVTDAVITSFTDGGEFLWVGTLAMSDYGLTAISKSTDKPVAYFDDTNSGLKNKLISAIDVDSDGHVWIANGDIICEYDGKSWIEHVFDNHVPNTKYTNLVIDTDGNIWCVSYHSATGSTVAMLEGDTWTTYTKDNDAFLGNELTSIDCDTQGNVCLGSNGGGVAMFDGAEWTVFTKDNSGLPDDIIYCIECDDRGRVWIGTKGGLALYENDTWTVYTQSDSDLPFNMISNLSVDANGTVWIMTKYYFTGKGMASLDGETWSLYDKNNAGLPNKMLRLVLCDNDGNVWVGSEGGGLVKYDGDSWQPVTTGFHYTPWSVVGDLIPSTMGPATCVLNGKIYVLGGSIEYGNVGSNYVIEYDPETNTKKNASSMMTSRHGTTANVVNGKIYVLGGRTKSGVTADVEEYDPTTETWTKKAPMQTARQDHASSVVNDKIYVFGGFTGSKLLTSVEVYDPATDTWTLKDDMPFRVDGMSSSVVDGKIYVMGGNVLPSYDECNASTTVKAYDPATNTWESRQPMPSSRAYFSTNVINGKIYAVCGASNNFMPQSTLLKYDPVTDTWEEKESAPSKRWSNASCAVNGKIYVFGGSAVRFPWEIRSKVDVYEVEDYVVYVDADVPDAFSLLSNYPNPFNPTTTINYSLDKQGMVNLAVYDILGRKVATLVDSVMIPGAYSIRWNAQGCASGIYFCRLKHGSGKMLTHKMLLVK